MALGLPQSDHIQVGNQAIAQISISKLSVECVALGIVLTKLFQVENLFNRQATEMVAENTREAASKQAISTLCRGIGAGVIGLFTLGGSFASPIAESMASKGLVDEQAEIDTMKEYRDLAKSPLAATDPKVTNEVPEKSLDAMQKKRMDRLSTQQDYKKEDLKNKRTLDDREMSDEDLIKLAKGADSEAVEALTDHLDELISKKESSMMTKRDMAYRKGDNVARALQGTGAILDAVAQGIGADYYQESGKYDAAKSVAASTQSMAASSESDLGSQIADAIRTAISAPETNVAIAQGDRLSSN